MPYMLETLTSVSLLTIMAIVGPILLLGGLVYGAVVAGRRRRSQIPAADAATRETYRDNSSTE